MNKPKFRQVTNDINKSDNMCFVPESDFDKIEGEKIVSVEVREDNEDIRIKLKTGRELRVFGKFMCPSFSLSHNAQAQRSTGDDKFNTNINEK